MDKIYLVLAITNNAEVQAHELYAIKEYALSRALQLAAHMAPIVAIDWLISDPNVEVLDDGSERWIFLETSKQYVGVHLLSVNEIGTVNFARSDHVHTANPVINTQNVNKSSIFVDTSKVGGSVKDYVVCALPELFYERYKKSSPGGFSTVGKAVTLQYVMEHPADVVPTKDLTEAQRYALVKARINHIVGYLCEWDSGLCWSKSHVELFLDSKNGFAKPIVDFECRFVDDARDSALRDLEMNDEESSSSSEDEW